MYLYQPKLVCLNVMLKIVTNLMFYGSLSQFLFCLDGVIIIFFVCVSVFAEDSSDGASQSSQRKNALTLLDPNFSNFQRGTRQTRVSNCIHMYTQNVYASIVVHN